MAKRLSPERLAVLLGHAPLEIVEHIEAVEEELRHTIAAWHDSQNELAALKVDEQRHMREAAEEKRSAIAAHENLRKARLDLAEANDALEHCQDRLSAR